MSVIPLHGLTVHRPFPWAMVHGSKRIENRMWTPPDWLIGKHLALHAGKTWDQDGADFVRELEPTMPGSAADHPIGIIAIVRIIGVIELMQDGTRLAAWWHEAPMASRRPKMRWFVGRFGWVFDDVVAMDPVIPCRGMQKLWTVPPDALSLARERWKAARAEADR